MAADSQNITSNIASHRRAARSSTRWHSFWLCLAITIVAIAVVLITRPAAAQTNRGVEIIAHAWAAQPNERHGAKLYRELCASCHGRRAQGRPVPVTPALAGQLTIYLIKQLVDFAEGDRNEPEMHRLTALKQLSTPQAIRDVSTYLSSLPANPRPEVGDGRDLANGKRYYDGLCAFCHGEKGQGDKQHATPALQRQHYSYLLMQSRQLAVGHRYSVPIEIIEMTEKLPLEMLMAVSDYASRLPDQASAMRSAEDAAAEPTPSDP
jgi:cytochrome c553